MVRELISEMFKLLQSGERELEVEVEVEAADGEPDGPNAAPTAREATAMARVSPIAAFHPIRITSKTNLCVEACSSAARRLYRIELPLFRPSSTTLWRVSNYTRASLWAATIFPGDLLIA